MRKSVIALSTALLLASAGAALAQSHQGGYLGLNPGGDAPRADQVATVPDPAAAQSTADSAGTDGFISPNDPRYQMNGAPRVGEGPMKNAPYAGIHGGHGY